MIKSAETLNKKFGLKFNDLSLLKRALTHRSAEGENNERLEFLGDSILGYIIAENLYMRFGEADEGVLSRLRASLVNQTALAELARTLELGDYLILGSGELKSGGFRRDSILSDAVEAIIGAMLLDQGIEACRLWISKFFQEPMDKLTLQNWKKDPKTRLQELMQSRGLELPVYRLVLTQGHAHDQHFRVECQSPLSPSPSFGEGSSRKKAEQQAAEKMLVFLAQDLKIK